MRRLKSNQKHSCDYCRAKGHKEPAKWTERGKFSCNECKPSLDEDSREDDDFNEADYQTWLRL